MNYLDLCKRLRQEAGMSGSGPSAVTGQTGEMKRVVDWVAQAWLEIQNSRPDWRFMRVSFDVAISAGSASIIVSSTVSHPDKKSMIAVDAGGRWPLEYLEPEDFAWLERRNGTQTGKPQYVSMDSDGTIRFMPRPSEAFNLMGEYFRTPQALSANTDVPLMPERYHMMIVYLAMTYAGAEAEASNLYQDGLLKYERALDDLMMSQLPTLRVAGPLA